MSPRQSFGRQSLTLHRKLRGKIEVRPKALARTVHDLNLLYTPGVGAVAARLGAHPEEARLFTMKRNAIAIVSDGSAVLGLGNIGPEAAIPIMEGKAVIFKEFGGIDAIPLVLATQDVDEIVETVKRVAPVFGGVNLEDISAPRCFEIERRLVRELDIPVMHDDQHGTAIVVLAGLVNAFQTVGKSLRRGRIVISGAGAAGTAIAKILLEEGAGDIVVLDSKGVVNRRRADLSGYKRALARTTNPRNVQGGPAEALAGADAFVGVSRSGTVGAADVRLMAKDPIVFALANPAPEIMPEEARRGGARVIATGRSDFPNQINNALAFPGVFRGALDHGVRTITDPMKRRAAHALARLVKKPTPERIIPSLFDARVVKAVSAAIR